MLEFGETINHHKDNASQGQKKEITHFLPKQ